MVGPPKSLYDLRKVEGAVRVTCRACRATKLHDLEELISHRLHHRASTDWSVVRREMPCPATTCDSRDVRVDGVPFGRNAAELRECRARTLLINLALSVLSQAAMERSRGTVPTGAVRLALRVIHPALGNQEVLKTFWSEFTTEEQRAANNTHAALRWIVNGLVQRGHNVWAEYRT